MNEHNPNATARELRAYLDETGAPSSTLSILDAYLKDNPEAQATELLGHLIAKNDPPLNGTIQRAGKYLHGLSWTFSEPGKSPESESEIIANLRSQLELKDGMIRDLSAEKRMLQTQLAHANARLAHFDAFQSDQALPKRIAEDERSTGRRKKPAESAVETAAQ